MENLCRLLEILVKSALGFSGGMFINYCLSKDPYWQLVSEYGYNIDEDIESVNQQLTKK